MAARPGGQPTTQRRELEGLRVVPQGKTMRPKLVFQHRSEGTGLDARRPAGAIDLEHPVERGQVD